MHTARNTHCVSSSVIQMIHWLAGWLRLNQPSSIVVFIEHIHEAILIDKSEGHEAK